MPGSRIKEVRMNLPTILEAAALLGPAYEYLLPVAPTLDQNFLQQSDRPQKITLVPEALPALWHSRAGIVASGTATVEAAMMNTPFVMVYRVSRLTYLLGKPRVKVSRFAMVNLIADDEVVPELVQDDFTAQNVVDHIATQFFRTVSARAHDRRLGPGEGTAKSSGRRRTLLSTRRTGRRKSSFRSDQAPIEGQFHLQTVFPGLSVIIVMTAYLAGDKDLTR